MSQDKDNVIAFRSRKLGRAIIELPDGSEYRVLMSRRPLIWRMIHELLAEEQERSLKETEKSENKQTELKLG